MSMEHGVCIFRIIKHIENLFMEHVHREICFYLEVRNLLWLNKLV